MFAIRFGYCIGVFLAAVVSATASTPKQAKLWEPVDWTFENPGCEGNPYDLIAAAVFTHQESGQTIRTELFYDTASTWKLRFTGTQTGRWTFVTESADPDLNSRTGQITILPNPGVPGFITHYGSKWGRLGTDEAFVPQYVMYADPDTFYRKPEIIDADIREFIVGHGFNGFHIGVLCRWFDLDKTSADQITDPDPNPDPRTFEAIELLLKKVHAAGGVVHIWAWGDEQRRMTPHKWGLNGPVDHRLQRYICARLGPLPGWTMGYGFDLQEWASEKDLQQWHAYMHEHLGWFHFLGGRSPELTQIDPHLDYASYQQHRPDYDTYVRAIAQYPDKPTFFEDRFRVRENVYPDKDYDFDMTRRGLWQSTMAGGAANIWGNLIDPRPDGVSHPYPNKNQIHTWSVFWKHRFKKQMIPDNSITDGVCLKDPSGLLVFYKEDTDTLMMDLAELKGPLHVIAVDTKAPYKEIELTDIKAQSNRHFNAPNRSDWAVAVETLVSGTHTVTPR